jgi:hypothetical protein
MMYASKYIAHQLLKNYVVLTTPSIHVYWSNMHFKKKL